MRPCFDIRQTHQLKEQNQNHTGRKKKAWMKLSQLFNPHVFKVL